MNKFEFLKILKESLSSSLDDSVVRDQLNYYDNYINEEIKKGRTEKEVLDELGDPRLIAKTIKTVEKNNLNVENSYNDNYNSDNYDNDNSRRRTFNQNRNYNTFMGTDTTIGCIIGLLVVFIIVLAILRFFGIVIYGLGTFAISAPIGFLIFIILFWALFGGRR